MSTAPQGTYQVGSLSISPLPTQPCFALTTDQFLTLRDGEMSVARSARDICIGVFFTGLTALAGIIAPLDDWRKAPFWWTLVLSTSVLSALVVGGLEQFHMHRTRTQSAYARVVQTISQYFKV
jgi:hypothetical protein